MERRNGDDDDDDDDPYARQLVLRGTQKFLPVRSDNRVSLLHVPFTYLFISRRQPRANVNFGERLAVSVLRRRRGLSTLWLVRPGGGSTGRQNARWGFPVGPQLSAVVRRAAPRRWSKELSGSSSKRDSSPRSRQP